MASTETHKIPHRRYNPLTREWVLVSPQRTQRPWLGRVERTAPVASQPYDPQCYLCPGNARARGVRNPRYESTFAFENDFPALLPQLTQTANYTGEPLLLAIPDAGICRVLCFSPRHDLTLPRMTPQELRAVIEAWIQEARSLEANSWVRYVQIFENRGELMGASNPHPHCQIWASASIPNLPQRELESFDEYHKRNQRCLLCDYVRVELGQRERLVCENEVFLVLVPFWAVWPFETLILSKRHLSAIGELASHERDGLADILRRTTIRYDNLFETPFPYSMGFHQRPSGPGQFSSWHFHAHFFPPLLRSATVQKFMVGYELLATPQRDISPEDAAARLAQASETHYLDRS